MEDSYLEDYRRQLHLHPEIINLNVGSCSVTPKPVLAAANQLRHVMAQDPVGFIWGKMLELIEDSRSALADYLNARPEDIILTKNASFAINTLVRGLSWHAGDRVLMTDQEYEHYYPLWSWAKRHYGILTDTLKLPNALVQPGADANDIVSSFAAQLTSDTTHLFFSHVTAPTGLRLPAKALVELAKKRGITTIIDGAHAPGLVSVDLTDIGADFYLGNVHKWLMGMPTAGFLHVGSARHVEPLLISRYAAYDKQNPDAASMPNGPSHYAASMEYHGTEDRIAQAVIKDALAFRLSATDRWVYKRCEQLRHYLHSELESAGFELVSFESPSLSTPMVTFKTPMVDNIKVWSWFRDAGFEIAMKCLGTERYMRISLPAFLRESDLEQFLKCLPRVPWSRLA